MQAKKRWEVVRRFRLGNVELWLSQWGGVNRYSARVLMARPEFLPKTNQNISATRGNLARAAILFEAAEDYLDEVAPGWRDMEAEASIDDELVEELPPVAEARSPSKSDDESSRMRRRHDATSANPDQ